MRLEGVTEEEYEGGETGYACSVQCGYNILLHSEVTSS